MTYPDNFAAPRPQRNGDLLETGPFAEPPTYEQQQALTLFAATAILNGYIVAHVRDDTAKTVRMIAAKTPLVTA